MGGPFARLWSVALLLLLLGCAQVQAGKLSLTKQFRLATLFASPSFKGNYYTLSGLYGACYNVVPDRSIGSLMLSSHPATRRCEVWGVGECGGDGDGKDRPREITEDTDSLVWFGLREGRTPNQVRRVVGGRGVKSIRCFEKGGEEL